ncbi:MAG: hypothetical protein O7D91_13500 [Planctomycetota bacterium]|nr:hypothetical protein [Planctomycetota bacterium]
MSALIAASSPITEWWNRPEVAEKLPDERTHRLMGRLAKRCADHVHTLRKRAYRLGHDVDRAVRIWSHADGLAALAGRIQDDHSTTVTPQTLGNARTIYLAYTPDEYENRFSDLHDTHLLKAQQMLGSNREERNKLLDHAQDSRMSVARMQEDIKREERRRAAEERAAERAQLERLPTGLRYGQEVCDIRRLRDRSVALLRIHGDIPQDSIEEAARAIQGDGVIVLECPSISAFAKLAPQAKKHGLQTVHPVVTMSSSLSRNVRGLPIVDRYCLTILLSRSRHLSDRSNSQEWDNPMTAAQAEALIYNLIPEHGMLVDLGPGSLSTAAFALKHQREYIAIEEVSPDQEALQSESADCWSMVSERVRSSVSIGGIQWSDLSCCDKTIIARLVSGVEQMACPACTGQETHEEANHA